MALLLVLQQSRSAMEVRVSLQRPRALQFSSWWLVSLPYLQSSRGVPVAAARQVGERARIVRILSDA
jgi:hypothetical protein